MFWRWLTAGIGGLLAFVGVALLDCTYDILTFVDVVDLCVESDLWFPGGSVAAGFLVTLVGIAMIGYAWIPFLMDRLDLRKEREGLDETEEALVKNVHRLAHEASGPVENLLQSPAEREVDEVDDSSEAAVDSSAEVQEPDLTPHEDPIESLLRRVEVLETVLREEKVSPNRIEKHWIELLREANELHSSGVIDQTMFQDVNTRLLDLYVKPDEDPVSARFKVGSHQGS